MGHREIINYVKTMLKNDYDLLMNELLPNDKYIFTEKYLNGKNNKELKISAKRFKEFCTRVVSAIKLIKTNSFENISESIIRYRCKKLKKNKEYIDFCIDAFINRLPNQDLANKYFIDIRSVAVYKTNRKRELTTL